EWRMLVRQLVAGGFVAQDVAGYGGLSVTDAGGALLRGERTFHYRPDTVRRVLRKERQNGVEHVLTEEQADLIARLKKLRLEIAGRRHLPAYLIFSDRTLLEMERQAPKNLHEFAMINGVGASKLRDFGQLFVDAINTRHVPTTMARAQA